MPSNNARKSKSNHRTHPERERDLERIVRASARDGTSARFSDDEEDKEKRDRERKNRGFRQSATQRQRS